MKRICVKEEWRLCKYNCAFANSVKKNMAAARGTFDNAVSVNLIGSFGEVV